MQIFFKNKSAVIYYDPTLDALVVEYLDKITSNEQFIEINTEAKNAFEKLSTRKVVADIRRMGVISIESQNWILNNFIPAVIKHLNGEKPIFAQLINESDIFSKVAGSNVKRKSDNQDLNTTQFTNRKQMEAYLKSL
jgi:hypothetical protein